MPSDWESDLGPASPEGESGSLMARCITETEKHPSLSSDAEALVFVRDSPRDVALQQEP